MMESQAGDEVKYEAEMQVDVDTAACYAAWMDSVKLSGWLGECSLSSAKELSISSELPYLSGRHTVTKAVEGKELEYRWYIDGWPTLLQVKFEKVGEGKSVVKLKHSMDSKAAPKMHYVLGDSGKRFYLVGGSWEVALCRLRNLLHGRESVKFGPLLNDGIIQLSIEIDATPEKVWENLIDGDTMRKMAPGFYLEGTVIGAKQGERCSYGWYPAGTPEGQLEDGPGKVQAMDKGRKISLSWHGSTMSEVTWLIEKNAGGGTLLKFQHSSLPAYPTQEIWSYRLGWALDLEIRKEYLETGKVYSEWYTAK